MAKNFGIGSALRDMANTGELLDFEERLDQRATSSRRKSQNYRTRQSRELELGEYLSTPTPGPAVTPSR